MLSLNLPILNEDPSAAIRDVKSCKVWIAGLQLTNVQVAHAEVSQQLQQINHCKLPPRDRLKIVEQLRETICHLQSELAKKYAGKPVPLAVLEQQAWDNVCTLWRSLELAYRFCLQGCLDGDAGVSEHVALITQRCMRSSALLMLEYYRSYRQVEPEAWRYLHSLYDYAESQGYAEKAVKDSLNKQAEFSSPMAVYVQANLINLANPFQFSFRQLAMLDRWLDKWGARVTISATPASSELLEIDLQRSGAIMGMADPVIATGNKRYLEINRLSEGLRKRIKYLRNGGKPSELDLGNGCIQPACMDFLSELYKQWCERPLERICQRRKSEAEARLCFGIPAMHFFISGEQPFEATDRVASLGWKEAQELQMFGRVAEKSAALLAERHDYKLESWKILDESALGFCLMRQSQGSDRVALNQMLALKPEDSEQYVVGVVCWIILTNKGNELALGIRVLPGVPLAVAVKATGLNSPGQNKRAPALLLPEVSALQTQASLILPSGWYQSGKSIIAYLPATQSMKLQALLEKGSDYERVSFKSE